MKLIDLLTSPWAITRQSLEEICGIYSTHLRGEKIDIKAVEARLGRPLANEPTAYQVINGVAVLPVEGVMAPKANLMMQVSGGASTQMLARELQAAVADPSVRAIILQMDTPGGSVIGTPEFAAAIASAKAAKPTVAYTDGQMASAGYWTGSAADGVYISGSTTIVGSIGVVMAHRDMSQANQAAGLKVTEITAGKYKRIASVNAPLSKEGEATLQAQVDYIYGLFVDAVAANRGTSADAVIERMADGRTFIGTQAIDAGLVDAVSSLDALISDLSQGTHPAMKGRRANFSAGAAHTSINPTCEGTVMPQADTTITRESLERDHAGLFAQLRSEFQAEGASNERSRILAVREQALPGHGVLLDRLAMDGKTTGPEAAAAVLAAERSARAAAAQAHADDAPQAVPTSHAPDDKAEVSQDDKVAKAKAYAAEHKVDFVAALKALNFA
ncbi:MAG: S49 family peptidase [Rhizobacter sp.]